jgi:hypothetical protein
MEDKGVKILLGSFDSAVPSISMYAVTLSFICNAFQKKWYKTTGVYYAPLTASIRTIKKWTESIIGKPR